MPPPNEQTDEQLIEDANRGRAEAFEALYHRYRDYVHRLAWRFSGNSEDALDVLQDTFAYLLRKFPGFRLTVRMTTFLYPVVKHLAIARRRKRRPADLPSEAWSTLPAPPSVDTNNPRTELAAALQNLPEAQREIVLMRYADEMALAEIAVALNLPLGTVKSRLHHALTTLRTDDRARRYFQDDGA